MPEQETVLIITEKPAAALKIAVALGKPEKKNLGGVAYYELERDGKKILVGCAVGHLFSLKQLSGKGWPVFDIGWEPNFKVRKKDWSKKYYNALSKLCRQADSFIVACDYDVEGEVIGWNVLRFICKQDNAKRMKFSTLTSSELEEAYKNALPDIDFGQAYAGETRHKLDWLYGINLSRALMEAIKKTGSFKIMSIGRVQGPALQMVVEKEKAIRSFVSEPYWQVFLLVKNGKEIEVKYPKDITKKQELAKFRVLKGKEGIAATIKKQEKISPPAPFDLTTLQTEAYKYHKFVPSKTLALAQQLYLAGIISYPRTSSQKLPPSIQYKDIMKKLSKKFNKLTSHAKRDKPAEGKKSDPAHPSIYPTGEHKELVGDEKKLYGLIVKRFISCFCDDAVLDNKRIEVVIDDLKFTAKGIQIKQKGWMNVYPAKIDEKELPDLQGKVKITEIRIEEKMTKPPKRYTPASLVRELEKRDLGTKATRSSIVETLFDRGYIKGKSIEASALGISLIDSLQKHSPVIIDQKLTRDFEKEMDSIQTSKKSLKEKSEKIVKNAEKTLKDIEKQFRKEEDKIGKELMGSINHIRDKEREENTLTKCPKCGKGDLRIMYNRKSKRYFIACSAYPNCRNTYTLPPYGLMKAAYVEVEGERVNEKCQDCGFPLMLAIQKGKRPWKFCFNPECPSRKRQEEYKNNKEEKAD
jgi:DNA topoisomerase-1